MKSILCLLFLINYSLCLAQNHKGVYSIQREKNAFGNNSIISGSVVDFTTNQPLKVAFIKIDTAVVQTDTSGRFRHELPPGKHREWAGFIGYYKIDVGKINLRRGELIDILFRIKEDTTPLVD